MQTDILAIDFGTSNSAAAIATGNGVRRIPIERGAETLPTAVFFPAEGGAMRIGADAAEALIDGDSGRYMRALKSVLGDPLLHEPRMVGGRRRTLAEIIADFLGETRRRAEVRCRPPFSPRFLRQAGALSLQRSGKGRPSRGGSARLLSRRRF